MHNKQFSAPNQKTVPPARRRAAGMALESIAASYLTDQGLELIESNFSCKLGELDLIMKDGDTLVFVEVRSRSSLGFMDPVTSIDYRKQKKLLRSASVYLKYHGLTDRVPCRIDVIGVHKSAPDQTYQFDWIKDAIQPQL